MKDQEITVPVPLGQLKAVHEIWIEFSSIVSVTDRNEADSLMNLLEPLNERLADIVCEEWETLIDKAEESPQREGECRMSEASGELTGWKAVAWGSLDQPLTLYPFQYGKLHEVMGAIEELGRLGGSDDNQLGSALKIISNRGFDLMEQIAEQKGGAA
ncbi:hypothetical protein MYX82_03220 [Acidobacteria bacterium AH-259-D05]|nr:hypothetical protein [Acidobacteria bacterium AH-259-D05]